MGKLAEKLTNNQRVVTAEITPPKGAGVKKFIQRAEILKDHVDALNLTDCQRALVRMSSLAAARILIDHGFEPVFQLTCRDRNRIALQADLMGASALGIHNLLCLTGDPVKVGDCPTAKSVFDVEAVGLLEMVKTLQSGKDWSGHQMTAATKFLVGAVVNPTLHSNQLERMKKKVDAGAQFFQTQANYNIEDFHAFMEQAKPLGTKTIAGILLLHTREMAEFVATNIPGIAFPEGLLEKFKKAQTEEEQREVGLAHAVESMLQLESLCVGFHLMTIRAEEMIPTILERYYDKSLFPHTLTKNSAALMSS